MRNILIILFIVLVNFKSVKTQIYIPFDSIKVSGGSYFLHFDQETDNLLVCKKDGTLEILKVATKESQTLALSDKPLNKIAVNHTHIAVSDTKGNLFIIDKKKQKKIKNIYIDDNIVALLFLNNDLFFGGEKGVLYKYSMDKSVPEEIHTFSEGDDLYSITDIKYNPENDHIIVCAGDLNFFSSKSPHERVRNIANPEMDFSTVAVRGGQLAAWSYYQKKLVYWKDYWKHPERTSTLLTSDSEYASHILFLNDTTLISGDQKDVLILNTKTNEVQYRFDSPHLANILSIDCVNFNKIIVTGDIAGNIFLWKYYQKFSLEDLQTDAKVTLPNILFHNGDTNYIFPDLAQKDLDVILQKYKSYSPEFIRISLFGYTDAGLDKSKMQSLSEQRAGKVKNDLVRSGIPQEIIQSIGKGIVDKVDSVNREKNRRVDIEFNIIDKKSILDNLKKYQTYSGLNFPLFEILPKSKIYYLLENERISEDTYWGPESLHVELLGEDAVFKYFRYRAETSKFIYPPGNQDFSGGRIILNTGELMGGVLSPGEEFRMIEKSQNHDRPTVKFYVIGCVSKLEN